jgi:BON domain-containing protein
MTDRELQQHVQNALDWEPSVESSAQEAEKAAWAAPGVAQVDDRLTIVP